MPKQTKQQRIDELELTITDIYKKVRFGLMSQIKRKDRDPIKVGTSTAENVIELCCGAIPNLGPNVSK